MAVVRGHRVAQEALLLVSMVLAVASTAAVGQAGEARAVLVNGRRLHAFFYLWYGNPEHDGVYLHWDHFILPHWTEPVNHRFRDRIKKYHNPDLDSVHSPYYPLRGPYSSKDPQVIRAQLIELRDHGVDVVALSWWGRPDRGETADSQGVNTDEVVPLILREADALGGIRVAWHLEPYPGRDVESVRQDLTYIVSRYGGYKSFLALYYVYDSYHIAPQSWARLLSPAGDLSVRGGDDDSRSRSNVDGVFLGLWLESHDGEDLVKGGFDGFYTYFASSGFSYGSTPSRWARMVEFARDKGMLSVLSVGPGYHDTKIRPWNEQNTRDREEGGYLDRMFEAALRAGPHAVSLTSYNEWGEGTQLEPAICFSCNATWPGNSTHLSIEPYAYECYKGGDPYFYLKRVSAWGKKLHATTQLVHEGGSTGTEDRREEEEVMVSAEGAEDLLVDDDMEEGVLVGEDEPEAPPLPDMEAFVRGGDDGGGIAEEL